MKLEEGAKIPSLEDKQMMQNQGLFGDGNSSNNLIVEYKLASVDLFYSDVKEYIDEYNADKPDGEKLTFDIQRAADRSIWLEMLPTLIMFVIIGVFWFI